MIAQSERQEGEPMRDGILHPLTGALLEPIGFTAKGTPIWPVLGASEAPPEGTGGSGSGSGSEGGGGSGDGGEGGGSTEGGTGDSGAKKTSEETVSRSEFDNLMRRMQAADKARSDAEKKAKELEDKDKSELERAQEQAKSYEKQVETLQSENKSLRLKVAFLTDTQFTWHDPADALMHLERDESVTIDEKGEVHGVKEAIKRLGTAKKYLVKSDGDGEKPPKSGDHVGAGGQKTDKADRERLIAKYNIRR